MSLKLFIYIGPYVKCSDWKATASLSTDMFYDKHFDEQLVLHNINHRNEEDDECWIPNKIDKYNSHYADKIESLINERDTGEVCLDSLDMDKECDNFEDSYSEAIKFLKESGREVEICYGLLVSYD